MKNFNLYSAQTGSSFGTVRATDETDALNKFAQRHGYEGARAMWAAGWFEYVSAAA
jgi:hypothetical protein